MKKVIRRTRKNAKTEFEGIPSRFKFKVEDKFFPYSAEAYKFAAEGETRLNQTLSLKDLLTK